MEIIAVCPDCQELVCEDCGECEGCDYVAPHTSDGCPLCEPKPLSET